MSDKKERWIHSYKGYNFIRNGTKEYPWNVYEDDGQGFGEHITYEKSLKMCKEFVDDLLLNESLDIIDNDGESQPITAEEEDFARELFNIIQELIDMESTADDIEEDFTSSRSCEWHYKKHCLDGNKKKSSKTNIYYDFTDMNLFNIYEQKVSKIVLESPNVVYDLYDIEYIGKLYRKLFEGNQSIRFETTCGFENQGMKCRIGLHSFSSHVTQNYGKGNTIDLIAISPRSKTITMYPVDATYLQRKLNNLIKSYTGHSDIEYSFNH